MDYNLIEIVTCKEIDGVRKLNRGKFKKLNSVFDVDLYGKEIECHNSVFLHNDKIIQYIAENKKIRGYNGLVKSSALIFDIDNKDKNISLQETKKLIKKLCTTQKYNIHKDDVFVYFSGNKGFHIYVKHNELSEISGDDTVQAIKEICSVMAEGIIGFDDQIYTCKGTIRSINSLHQKTNLFKIPLKLSELNENIDYIINIAKKQRRL